jgi:hypothetical protein
MKTGDKFIYNNEEGIIDKIFNNVIGEECIIIIFPQFKAFEDEFPFKFIKGIPNKPYAVGINTKSYLNLIGHLSD